MGNSALEQNSHSIYNKLRRIKGGYIPFFLVAFVIPLIMLRIPIEYNRDMQQFLLSTAGYEDYFHLVKTGLLYFSTFLLAIFFILRRGNPFPRIFLILIPYTACVFLSAWLSDNKASALTGIFDHYEGAFTQLCYICLFLFSCSLYQKDDDILFLFKAALSASLVVALIGLFQYVGYDPLREFIFKSAAGADDPLYTVSSTIGNSNYVGTYAILLLPISISLMLTEKNRIKKWVYLFLFFGAAFFLLFASMSRAGFVGLFVICPLFFVLLGKRIKEQIPWILAVALYGLILIVGMNILSKGGLLKELKSMNPFSAENTIADKLIFEDIQLGEASAVIKTNQWLLTIQSEGDGFYFLNESGKATPVRYSEGSQRLVFVEEPYKRLRAWVQKSAEYQWLLIDMEGKDIQLVSTARGMKVVGYNGKLAEISAVEAWGFAGNEAFASGRGYIWSRSLPLLKKAIWIGYGPDTFPFIFPQNDIVGKLNYGAIGAIISKPHSWYLQIALGSGVFSLLCLIILLYWYGVKAIKICVCREVDHRTAFIVCGIFLSAVGCCVVGIFNDSVVSVAPIFWTLLGFGSAMFQTRDGQDTMLC